MSLHRAHPHGDTSPPPSRFASVPWRAASRGALVGAAAGTVLALADFGASWLWLTWWRDRWELLLRLLATLVPVGAVAAACATALLEAARPGVNTLARRLGRRDPERVARWARRLWPLPWTAAAAPALAWVAYNLFTGGMTSELPARDVLVGATGTCLVAGTWLAFGLGRATWEHARRLRRLHGLAVAVALLGLGVGISKLDQHAYPKLYEYLHGVLTAAAFAVACLTVLVAGAHSTVARRLDARWPWMGLAALAVLGTILGVDVATLGRNQNVRVALFHSRAASSRSVMKALEPLLPEHRATRATAEAIARARRARERRHDTAQGLELPTSSRAHVLIVTIDALRADHVGAYGYERGITPHLDRLAKQSVVFEHAYAQAPHSSYSLCSFMVSEYLHETVELGRPLPPATLATAAAGAGLHTSAFYTEGIFHTEGERLARYRDNAFGFAYHDHTNADAEQKTDLVLEHIDRIVERGEPASVIWAHYFDVHEPYRETALGTSNVDRYDGEIRNVDRAFGRLLREARERLDRELVVVVSADHGEEFRDHGGVYHGSTLYDEQVRVPLIVEAPDLEARRVEGPVELVDVAPTLLKLLHVPVPGSMRGDDLRALAAGRVEGVGPAFAGVMHKRMAVRWPYKLIADLRFNLFEIYDLDKDPDEQHNLASRHPELLDSLKGEIYAWLDSLQKKPGGAPRDPREVALARGHLADRRGVETLAALVADDGAERPMRIEAARILGNLGDERATRQLAEAMHEGGETLSAEAAIALGRMYDTRARNRLRELMYSEDPQLRARAAIALGRLEDPKAVPGLIDALEVAESKNARREAVRWLGRLRAERAVEPLIEAIPRFPLRRLAAIALGKIGDRRAFEPLRGILEWEHRPNIRDAVVKGLGYLGDPRAIPRLIRLAVDEPGLKYTGESLVRLDAIARGAVGGTDVGPRTEGLRGFAACRAKAHYKPWEYLGRTWCETRWQRVGLELEVPPDVAGASGLVAVARVRRTDADAPVITRVRVGEHALEPVRIDGSWGEKRWTVSRDALDPGGVRATLKLARRDARLAVDHLLLVPEPKAVATAHSSVHGS